MGSLRSTKYEAWMLHRGKGSVEKRRPLTSPPAEGAGTGTPPRPYCLTGTGVPFTWQVPTLFTKLQTVCEVEPPSDGVLLVYVKVDAPVLPPAADIASDSDICRRIKSGRQAGQANLGAKS